MSCDRRGSCTRRLDRFRVEPGACGSGGSSACENGASDAAQSSVRMIRLWRKRAVKILANIELIRVCVDLTTNHDLACGLTM